MKYVKNTGRYAVAYAYNQGIREIKVEFDRQRIYKDTGNIATTGITPLDDEVFEALKKENKLFNKAIKEGTLTLVDEKALVPSDRTAALEKENADLRAQIASSSNENTAKLEAEKAALEQENAEMKAKLEALAKENKKKSSGKPEGKSEEKSEEKPEDEGF